MYVESDCAAFRQHGTQGEGHIGGLPDFIGCSRDQFRQPLTAEFRIERQ